MTIELQKAANEYMGKKAAGLASFIEFEKKAYLKLDSKDEMGVVTEASSNIYISDALIDQTKTYLTTERERLTSRIDAQILALDEMKKDMPVVSAE